MIRKRAGLVLRIVDVDCRRPVGTLERGLAELGVIVVQVLAPHFRTPVGPLQPCLACTLPVLLLTHSHSSTCSGKPAYLL